MNDKATVTLNIETPNREAIDKWLTSLENPRTLTLSIKADDKKITELSTLINELKAVAKGSVDLSGFAKSLTTITQLSKGFTEVQDSAQGVATAMRNIGSASPSISDNIEKQVVAATKALQRMQKSIENTLYKTDAGVNSKYALTGEYSDIYKREYEVVLQSIRNLQNLDDGEAVRKQAQSLQQLAKVLNELQAMGSAPTGLNDLRDTLDALRDSEPIPKKLANSFEKLYDQLGKVNPQSLADVLGLQVDVETFTSKLEKAYDDLGARVRKIVAEINEELVNGIVGSDTSRLDQYQKYFAQWSTKLKSVFNAPDMSFETIEQQVLDLTSQLKEYANVLNSVGSLDANQMFSSLDNIARANEDIVGLTEKITELKRSLQTSVENEDIVGMANIQNQINGMEAAIDAFTKAQQKLIQTRTKFSNSLESGLFGAVDTKTYREASKAIEALDKSINSLTMDSSSNDWLNVRAQIELIRTLQTEVRGVLNETRLSTKKTSLTNDIQLWAQDNVEAAKTVQTQIDVLIDKIKSADAQQFSNLRKEFSQLKTTAAQNINDITLELDRTNFENQIAMWTQKYPAAAKVYSAELTNIQNQLKAVDSQGLGNLKKQFSNLTQEANLFGLATKSLGDAWRNLVDNYSASAMILMLGSQIEQTFSRALDTLKEVDTYLTEISKVSDMTTAELVAMSDEAFDSASKYGESVTTYLQGIQEWSRTGMGDNASALAELTVLAKSAGDMTSDMATSYLIATNAAYQLGGSVSELNAILDGQNQITNRNAVSMEELANATRIAGAQAATSGISIDKFSAAVGTMQAITQQGGSTAGRAFRTILMNLQQISGTTDDGEVLDATSFNKVEKALHAIGVATSGVKNGLLVLRDPMEVLAETAEVVSQLSDDSIKKANVLSSLGGKYRATQLAALLDNWSLYEKMLSDYNDNSLGSAAAEAEKTANSWAGSLARMQNSVAEFVGEFVKADVVIDGINMLNAGIKTMTALASGFGGMNSLAGITTFITSFKTLSTLSKGVSFSSQPFAALKEFAQIASQSFARSGDEATTFKQKLSGLGTTFKEIGAKAREAGGGVTTLYNALMTVRNLAVSLAISAIVNQIFTRIQDEIHKAERIAEEAEQALNDYENAREEITTKRENVTQVKDEYLELSSGVDSAGRNLGLTNDEYDRYIELSNQLAELLPSAVVGWDQNGNAILNCRNNAELLNQTLNETLDAMTAVADAELIQSSDVALQNTRNRYNQLLYDYGVSVGITDINSPNYMESAMISPDDFAAVMRAAAQVISTNFNDVQQVAIEEFENAIYQYLPEDLQKLSKQSNLIAGVLNSAGIVTNGWDTYDVETMRSYLTSVQSDIALYQEDMARAEQDNRNILSAFVRESTGYATLADSTKDILSGYLSQLDITFTYADEFTEAAANVWAANIVSAFQTIDDVSASSFTELNDSISKFSLGEINYGDYEKAINGVIEQLRALSEVEGSSITSDMVDNLIGTFSVDFSQYENEIRAISDAIVESAAADGEAINSWIDSLTIDQIKIAYDIVASDDSEYTLDEFQQQVDENINAEKAAATFTIGIYTEDIDNAISKLNALNTILSSLRSGTISIQDVLTFSIENPEYGDILGFVTDKKIDVAGMTNYLTGLYSQVISNTYSQIQSEIDYMTEDNPERGKAQAVLDILKSMFDPADISSADVAQIATGYSTAISAIMQATLERTVGHIENGEWVRGVSDQAVTVLQDALNSINIDTSGFIKKGMLYAVDWDTQAFSAVEDYLKSYTDGVIGASEQAQSASSDAIAEFAQTSYTEFADRISTLSDAYASILENNVTTDRVLEFSETFGDTLTQALIGGDTDVIRQALDDEIAAYNNYFANLISLSHNAVPSIQLLADNLSLLDDQAKSSMDIATVSRELAQANDMLDSAQEALDAKRSRGEAVAVSDYSELLNQSKQIVAINGTLMAVYQNMLDGAQVGSDVYQTATDGIRECETAINDAKNAQYEWNQEILDTFGYSGTSSLISDLTSSMEEVYAKTYGGSISAETAIALKQWLGSVGVNPADFISVDYSGIQVDQQNIRELAYNIVQQYIDDLRIQLANAEESEKADLQFELNLMLSAQAEITGGISDAARLQGMYSSLQDQMSLISQAYAEEASASGLTIETYQSLIDLNASYADALEYTNGAMRLNKDVIGQYTDALREQIALDVQVAKTQDKQKYEQNAKRIEKLVGAYESVEQAYLNLDEASRSELVGLLGQNKQLAAAIDNYNLLASSLDDASAAYSNWLSAQEGPSPDDWFYAGQTAYEQYQEGLESGKVGAGTQYSQAVDLLFANSDPSEEGKKYVDRYFDGAKDEMDRMMTFVQDLVDWGYLVEENGDYVVSEFIDLDALAEQTGLTEFALKSLFQNLNSYGFEFDWFDSDLAGVEGFESEYLARIEQIVNAARDRLSELELKPTLTVDETAEKDTLTNLVSTFDSTQIKTATDDALGLIGTAVAESTPVSVPFDFDQEDIDAKIETLQALVDEAIDEGYVADESADVVDASAISGQLTSMQELIDSIQLSLTTLTMQIVTVDAEASIVRVQSALFDLMTQLTLLSATAMGTFGAEKATNAIGNVVSTLQSVSNQVSAISQMSIGTLGANTASNMLRTVYSLLQSINNFRIADKTFTVRSINLSSGTNAASAQGTTNAKAGNTLVGELKPEILVRDGHWYIVGQAGAEFVDLKKGDIVIDGDNTEKLLRGQSGARGRAMANGGQAMAAGGSVFSTIAYGLSNTLSSVVKKVSDEVKKITTEVKKSGIASGGGNFTTSSSGSSSKKPSSSSSSSSKKPSSSSGSSSNKTNSSAGSSSSSKDDETEVFDWIEIKLERLTQSIDKLIDDADTKLSYLAKNEDLADAMDVVNEKIDATTKAYKEYIDMSEKVAKESGLSSEIKEKVQSGDIALEEYNDDIRESISEYQTWYDKAQEMASALYDLNEQQRELATQKLDNIINYYDKLNDAISQQQDITQAQIDVDKAQGKAINASSYQEMIDAEQNKIQNTQSSIDTTKAELNEAVASGVIEEGSDEWYEYSGKINSMTTSILNSQQAIAEYEQEIVNLRLLGLNYSIEEADNALDTLEDEVALKQELGRVVDETDYRQQVEAVLAQAEAQKALLAEYQAQLSTVEEGSERYYELSSEVADVEDNLRGLQLSQAKLNRLIAEMPITRYENALEIIEATQGITKAMMELHEVQGEANTDEEYETLIRNGDEQIDNLQKQSAEYSKLLAQTEQGSDLWQDYKTALLDIDQQIIEIKTAQEEWNDAIVDLRIDQLEEQRDELEKQNDAYQRRLELEEALQELERARTQKNIQVYREGIGFVWEANQEAIREAEENLSEKQHEETLAKIDEAIDALEDFKDVNNLYDYLANRVNTNTAADMLNMDDITIGNIISDALKTSAVSIANKLGSTLLPSAATTTYNSSAPVVIERIEIYGVQNVDGLADAIVRELPNKITQKLMNT